MQQMSKTETCLHSYHPTSQGKLPCHQPWAWWVDMLRNLVQGREKVFCRSLPLGLERDPTWQTF